MAKDKNVTTKKEEVPQTNLPDGAGEAPKKEKVLIEGITRGRMPIAIVAMVRFGDQKNGETKALATLFGTTVGKITDIKKRSTFAYLTEKFVPSQVQKDEGIAWLKRHVSYKDGTVDGLINELEKTKIATPEEAAAFEAIRKVNKGQKATTEAGAPVAAGGGNRTKAKTKKKEDTPPYTAGPSGDDLLS